MSDKNNKKSPRGADRRQIPTDSTDLPFPDRRQKDRRVYSEEEREEILRRIAEEEAAKAAEEKK
ncbi:hypothetical protein KJ564_01450 [bacterium]|nr:hypothetical protein [bacterium]MBU1880799.1 hypothetical protein [bacterium]